MPLESDHLSPHFTLAELTVTSTGLPNLPDLPARYALKALCSAILEPLREHVGPIRVTSAYRSAAVNTRVGGSATSQHTKGEAADVVFVSFDRLRGWLRIVQMAEQGFPIDQAIIYETTGHIHVSHTADRVARRELLVYTRGRTFESWASWSAANDAEARFGAPRDDLESTPLMAEMLPHPPDPTFD